MEDWHQILQVFIGCWKTGSLPDRVVNIDMCLRLCNVLDQVNRIKWWIQFEEQYVTIKLQNGSDVHVNHPCWVSSSTKSCASSYWTTSTWLICDAEDKEVSEWNRRQDESTNLVPKLDSIEAISLLKQFRSECRDDKLCFSGQLVYHLCWKRLRMLVWCSLTWY